MDLKVKAAAEAAVYSSLGVGRLRIMFCDGEVGEGFVKHASSDLLLAFRDRPDEVLVWSEVARIEIYSPGKKVQVFDIDPELIDELELDPVKA